MLRGDDSIVLVHYLEHQTKKRSCRGKNTFIGQAKESEVRHEDHAFLNDFLDVPLGGLDDLEGVLGDLPAVHGFQEFDNNLFVHILDFSPDWDFVTGGAKVLICLDRDVPTDAGDIRAKFGTVEVQVERMTPTVLRCRAPPCAAGSVELCLMLKRGSESQQLSGVSAFTYKTKNQVFAHSANSSKRNREKFHLEVPRRHDQEDGFLVNERKSKIRIVAKLSGLHRAISSTNNPAVRWPMCIVSRLAFSIVGRCGSCKRARL